MLRQAPELERRRVRKAHAVAGAALASSRGADTRPAASSDRPGPMPERLVLIWPWLKAIDVALALEHLPKSRTARLPSGRHPVAASLAFLFSRRHPLRALSPSLRHVRYRAEMPRRRLTPSPAALAADSSFASATVAEELRHLLGANFREARIRAGISQRDVQRQFAIQQHYISELENGLQNPTLAMMAALAHAVGTEVQTLLQPWRKRRPR